MQIRAYAHVHMHVRTTRAKPLSAALAERESQKVGDDACSTATRHHGFTTITNFGVTECAPARAHTRADAHAHARYDEAQNQGTHQLAHAHAHTTQAHARA